MKKKTVPTKHKTLIRFIETADSNCESHYYGDPFFNNVPKALLYSYIDELASEGYLKKYTRYVRLTAKTYSYKRECRIKIANKLLSILGKPVSYLITWILGILSALTVQYLIKILGLYS